MNIRDLREYFKKKIKSRPTDSGYKFDENYDMGDGFTVQEQLTKLVNEKKFGKQKVFYLTFEQATSNTDLPANVNLKLISEDIYIDELNY